MSASKTRETTSDPAPKRAWSGGITETHRRPLRVFAFDPMQDRFRDPVVLRVPLEFVKPGPVGRLVEVVDIDLTTERALPPLDLDALDVTVGEGLAPSEIDPRSHQQMVYAVAMQVLETFERALGRPIIWQGGSRLLILPHAEHTENAFFDPASFSLRFGYFEADKSAVGSLARQTVYSCLSFDVVSHQTAHPVLTQLRPEDPEAKEPASNDWSALHEGYADLVALLVRMSEEQIVARCIATQGLNLLESELFVVGGQFGAAAGLGSAIRRYPIPVGPNESDEPHDRGAALCSAFVEGLIRYVNDRVEDLVRLYGNVTNVRWMHPDLANRVAFETAQASRDLLSAAIAAFDYLPTVNVCFGDALRAFITVDRARFGARHTALRARIIEAFAARRLAPRDIDSLAEEALVLPPAHLPDTEKWRLPRATDTLLLTVQSLEHRRRSMTSSGVDPQDEDALRAEVAKRDHTWLPEIAAFGRRNARRLGLDPKRKVFAAGLDASLSPLADGSVRGRVVVQLRQASAGEQTSRGVAIVADADGTIQHVIRASRRSRRKPWSDRPMSNEQSLLAKRVGGPLA